jgi:hypothetical protein
MQLLYDVTIEPIAWASMYLLWLCALVGIFFFVIFAMGKPGTESDSLTHKRRYVGLAALVACVALGGTVLGLTKRSKCIELVQGATSVEGPVQDLKRGRSTYSHTLFQVDGHHFNTEPGVFDSCGLVRSATDVAALSADDYVRVTFDGLRVLKLWRRQLQQP